MRKKNAPSRLGRSVYRSTGRGGSDRFYPGMLVIDFTTVSQALRRASDPRGEPGQARKGESPPPRGPSPEVGGGSRAASATRRWITLLALTITGLLLPAHAGVAATLAWSGTIRTSPFSGTTVSMGDNEGSSFVPSDKSLWLADDRKKRIYDVNPATGALKRTIARRVFNKALRFRGGPPAGKTRTNDFEAIAYDRANDVLYVFSGPCCSSSTLPTVFRLKRRSGRLRVDSYQPLASGADYTAAAWSPADKKLYVGKGRYVQSFHYATRTTGGSFEIGVTGITGMDFSPDGANLFVTNDKEELVRVDWSTRTPVSGETFDLTPFGVRDSRGVAAIGNRFFVSDGYDARATEDPLRHAVFVFDVR